MFPLLSDNQDFEQTLNLAVIWDTNGAYMTSLYYLLSSRFVNSNVYYFLVLSTPSLAGDFYLNFFLGGVMEIPAYTAAIITVKYVIVTQLYGIFGSVVSISLKYKIV